MKSFIQPVLLIEPFGEIKNKFFTFKTEIKWFNTFLIISYHLIAVYWCYHYAFPVKWQSVLFAIIMIYASTMGASVGAHRYWTHRSFKATRPLQMLMLLCFTIAGQNTVQEWVRDHRVHHKQSDTMGDPHNANRGLFYSHIGWLMMKKHPEVIRTGQQVDISDIEKDPLLQWHKRHFAILKLSFCFVLPTLAGMWMWGETWRCAVAWQCFIRYLTSFHSELTVNSLAHTFGYRPYNKNLQPTTNWFVDMVAAGEGNHNFHHVFPYDFRSNEKSMESIFSLATNFIEFWAKFGMAYDCKEANMEMVKLIARKQGDGTRHHTLEDQDPKQHVQQEVQTNGLINKNKKEDNLRYASNKTVPRITCKL